MVQEELVAIAVMRGDSVLLRRGEIVKGMWELPYVCKHRLDEKASDSKSKSLQAVVGMRLEKLICYGKVRHTVMNRRLVVEVWKGKAGKGTPASGSWHRRCALESLGLSALTKKLLARIPRDRT